MTSARQAILGLMLALGAGAAQAGVLSAMVVMGADGVPEARVITDAEACPAIKLNGKMRVMLRRAGPQRSASADFPVTACEAWLPNGAQDVRVVGRLLRLPRPLARRIVMIGAGCLSASAGQACDGPASFAQAAAEAAAWRPDLVIHLGGGPSRASGTDSWDAWKTGFFDPAAPLLAVAPWIVVRGDAAGCAGAGAGWMRFLDPRLLTPEMGCSAAPAYLVPLGEGAQVTVLDTTEGSPGPAAEGAGLAVSAHAEPFSSWMQGAGFLTLERRRADAWDVQVRNFAGEVVRRCRIEGRGSSCDDKR